MNDVDLFILVRRPFQTLLITPMPEVGAAEEVRIRNMIIKTSNTLLLVPISGPLQGQLTISQTIPYERKQREERKKKKRVDARSEWYIVELS